MEEAHQPKLRVKQLADHYEVVWLDQHGNQHSTTFPVGTEDAITKFIWAIEPISGGVAVFDVYKKKSVSIIGRLPKDKS